MATIRYRVPTLSIAAALGSVPAWYAALAHKQWVAPLNNATAIAANQHWIGASGVKDPNASAPGVGSGSAGAHDQLFYGYSGLGADATRSTVWSAANGGHNNYGGNEVYAADLRLASPVWSRLRNATTSVPNDGNDYSKWPSDGRPSANHNMQFPIGAEGRWLIPGCGSRSYNGGSDWSQWWEFDVNSTGLSISGQNNDWIDRGSSHANSGGAGNVFSAMAVFDPADRHVITARLSFGNVMFTPLDTYQGAAEYTNTSGNFDWVDYTCMALDTTNRVLLIIAWNSWGTRVRAFKIDTVANKVAAPRTESQVPVSGSPPQSRSDSALHWHPPSNAFLCRATSTGSSQNLWKLTPTVVGGVYTGLTWSQVTSGWSGATPVQADLSGAGGVQKKFHLMLMPDGSYAAVFWGQYAFPDLWVCRLTGGI